MALLLIVLLPFIGSLCAAFLPTNARNAEAWLAGIIALTVTLLTATQYPQLAVDGVLRLSIPWSPTLGIDFQLRMDGYAWLFAMLVALIGTLVVI
jgi:multicomponent K+:H+ antiporter subunit A